EEAIAGFRASGDRLGTGNALVHLATARWQQGETEHAEPLLAEAVNVLEAEPPGPELAHAYAKTAGRYMLRGRARECIEWANRSIAETCWPLYDLGDWNELLRAADGVFEHERRGGAGQPGVMAASYKAYVLVSRGALDEAVSLCRSFLPRARTIHDPQVLLPA